MNAKQLLQSMGLLIQMAPSELWGEAMHNSGLFPHLLKTLLAEEVSSLPHYRLKMNLQLVIDRFVGSHRAHLSLLANATVRR
jgi:hypothetical protein